MTIGTELSAALAAFDAAAQDHGWASDQGSATRAAEALSRYTATKETLLKLLSARAGDGKTLTDEQIDLIAGDGMRNAAGGIYATSVHQFARACIAAATQELQARITSLSREAWEWSKALEAQIAAAPAAAPAVPLTEDNLLEAFCKARHSTHYASVFIAGARFAERAHGIQAPATGDAA